MSKRDFGKIIGYKSIVEELKQVADILKNPDKYEILGVKAPRGILFHGVPGVGKTLMAMELARASLRKTFICGNGEGSTGSQADPRPKP